MPRFALAVACLCVAMGMSVCGCASAVAKGHNTALDSIDLVQMTDRMAMSLLASPGVGEALREQGRLAVVIQPVENYMTAEILPRGSSHAFVGRLRSLLAMQAPEKFLWVMNRDAYYRLRSQELEGLDLGPSPEAIQPRYALTARFDSLADESTRARSASYVCSYQLMDLQTRQVIWTDRYEVHKTAVKKFLD